MRNSLFHLPENSHGNLQAQIREMLVAAILEGQLPPKSALPSGRKLAQQLKVARNTVVLVYQQLVDEGFLASRERSGYYVAEDVLAGRVKPVSGVNGDKTTQPNWKKRLIKNYTQWTYTQKPANWREYPYPFVYGQFDPALFPINDWRECSRESVSVGAIYDWAGDRIDSDDPLLVEQIHTRLLPRRGVWAGPENILVTLGAQQALFLVAQLLIGQNSRVAVEEPGYPDARNVLANRTPHLQSVSVDEYGLLVDQVSASTDYLYATPSHQHPTTITMSIERRRELLRRADRDDFIIIEDDYESEINYVGDPTAALKSLDDNDRVIYVGSLSKTLAPGLRLGYLVAPPELIREARALRRLMLRHPPANNQHIVAQFILRGHHDSLIRRLTHSYKERWHLLGNALHQSLPGSTRIPTFGGTAYWLQCPPTVDTRVLYQKTLADGLIFEPGEVFFADNARNRHCLRLGFSSVSANRIRDGVAILASHINRLQ